jgi:hypothetical protein
MQISIEPEQVGRVFPVSLIRRSCARLIIQPLVLLILKTDFE